MRSDTAVFQKRELPASMGHLDVLPSDYVDVFTITAAGATVVPPEKWARAALEEASAVGRFMAWRLLLNLRLAPVPSQDHIAGWKIADHKDSLIRLAASSWFMSANIIFQVAQDRVTFATLIRYDNPVGRIVWTPVSAIHRRLAPEVLRAAVIRIARTQ